MNLIGTLYGGKEKKGKLEHIYIERVFFCFLYYNNNDDEKEKENKKGEE